MLNHLSIQFRVSKVENKNIKTVSPPPPSLSHTHTPIKTKYRHISKSVFIIKKIQFFYTTASYV